jgi:hypothetical protein
MLIRTLLWGVNRLIDRELERLAASGNSRRGQIQMDFYLAERSTINLRKLQQHLQEGSTRRVRQKLRKRKWTADRLIVHLRGFYILPARHNPLLVMSDALNNTARACYQQRFPLSEEGIGSKIRALPRLYLSAEDIDRRPCCAWRKS